MLVQVQLLGQTQDFVPVEKGVKHELRPQGIWSHIPILALHLNVHLLLELLDRVAGHLHPIALKQRLLRPMIIEGGVNLLF